MELEIIILAKISQTQKNIACFLSFAESIFFKRHKTRREIIWGAGGRGKGTRESDW
jgi:hypothetical protein